MEIYLGVELCKALVDSCHDSSHRIKLLKCFVVYVYTNQHRPLRKLLRYLAAPKLDAKFCSNLQEYFRTDRQTILAAVAHQSLFKDVLVRDTRIRGKQTLKLPVEIVSTLATLIQY
jgi:hypothetical protein